MIRLVVPEIGEDEILAVGEVLSSGYLVQGVHVEAFERLVADYVGVRHAVAVSSGTAALHLALLALDIRAGDEVIIPDFTFPATANVIVLAGATPVLVDVEPTTFNLDVTQLRQAITSHTRAIMPVHLFGLSADMDPILTIAEEFGIPVIEDAACALGASYYGRPCGSMGRIGCFSFHPRKVITTGEGGMAVTNDDELADRIRLLRNHGMVRQVGGMQFTQAGFNYRMTDFQGAMGRVQIQRLEDIVTRRSILAEAYGAALSRIPSIVLPATPAGLRHVWQSYVILIGDNISRDRIIDVLRERGIEATIGTYAVSAQPAYAQINKMAPNSLRAFAHSLCLPLHSRLSLTDIEEVADCLIGALQVADLGTV